MRELFNDGWEFQKTDIGTGLQKLRADAFAAVPIPHDWLIADVSNLYENSQGWYRKTFFHTKKENIRSFLEFDGIYMDCELYINNKKAFTWKYGYSSFSFEITDLLYEGENTILVQVKHLAPNSRWYSGAGIYRNIWLVETEYTRIPIHGVYISAKQIRDELWSLEAEVEVEHDREGISLSCRLQYRGEERQPDSDRKLETSLSLAENVHGLSIYKMRTMVSDPKLWSMENPNLYVLTVILKDGEKVLQEEKIDFGFRDIRLSDKGLMLNGVHTVLHGVCEHHDLGLFGAAFCEKALKRRLQKLKEMGVNAIRTAHNMPAREFMDLADQMGFLIVSEAFDMWELPKTEYDYARFFTEWYARDIASWIRRDRNHASLLFWSIGNEIYDTHRDAHGRELCMKLIQEVRRHDARANAMLTLGSNYMAWENTRACADLFDAVGYNYGEKLYTDDQGLWTIYGSETGSVVQSRGIYHFPYEQSLLTDADEQCSSLGNSSTSWGAKSTIDCILSDRRYPFTLGQFIWTGFDYIGEPTPYHTKNSYFGQIDTAGFAKDAFYLYQSAWTDYRKYPMVHLYPYWNFNCGEEIDVLVCSNAPTVALFQDGQLLERKDLDKSTKEGFLLHRKVRFATGYLEARAYDEVGKVIAEDRQFSFGDSSRLVLRAEESILYADGEDVLFVEVHSEDLSGNFVADANAYVHAEVLGNIYVRGMDNGNSTDADPYQTDVKRLFSGRLLIVLQAGEAAEEGERAKLVVSSSGMQSAQMEIILKRRPRKKGIARAILPAFQQRERNTEHDLIPIRRIELKNSGRQILTKEYPMTVVEAEIYPKEAQEQGLIWEAVDDAAIPLSRIRLEPNGRRVQVIAEGNGDFRLRCMASCGGKIHPISSIGLKAEGFARSWRNPYSTIFAAHHDGAVGELSNGNEKGIATARGADTAIAYRGLDFGRYGADGMEISIFALTDDPYPFSVYSGREWKDAILLDEFVYQKPKIWNVYQSEYFQFSKKLNGIMDLWFVFQDKVHIRDFFFIPAGSLIRKATEAKSIYGDNFRKTEEGVLGIGNNVTLVFSEIYFCGKKDEGIQIFGRSLTDQNSILIRARKQEEEKEFMLSFEKEEESAFLLTTGLRGKYSIEFIFLPGSSFDFYCWSLTDCANLANK